MRRRICLSLAGLTFLLLSLVLLGPDRLRALALDAVHELDNQTPTFVPVTIQGEPDGTTLQCVTGGNGCGSIPR